MRFQHLLTSLSFTDFLEFLGRFSDAISPPSKTDIVVAGFDSGSIYEYLNGIRSNSVPAMVRRKSGGMMGIPTRYLHVKIAQTLNLIIDSLCHKYGIPITKN